MMRASRMIAVFVAAIAAACAHHNTNTVPRGEPVGVNSVDAKSAPVTGSVGGGINPSPTAMATTTSSGSATTR